MKSEPDHGIPELGPETFVRMFGQLGGNSREERHQATFHALRSVARMWSEFEEIHRLERILPEALFMAPDQWQTEVDSKPMSERAERFLSTWMEQPEWPAVTVVDRFPLPSKKKNASTRGTSYEELRKIWREAHERRLEFEKKPKQLPKALTGQEVRILIEVHRELLEDQRAHSSRWPRTDEGALAFPEAYDLVVELLEERQKSDLEAEASANVPSVLSRAELRQLLDLHHTNRGKDNGARTGPVSEGELNQLLHEWWSGAERRAAAIKKRVKILTAPALPLVLTTGIQEQIKGRLKPAKPGDSCEQPSGPRKDLPSISPAGRRLIVRPASQQDRQRLSNPNLLELVWVYRLNGKNDYKPFRRCDPSELEGIIGWNEERYGGIEVRRKSGRREKW